MRLVHLSDIHVWRYPRNLGELLGKRLVATIELARGRAARFRLERLDGVVEHARSLHPDHVLITGDISTSSLPSEFAEARRALAPLLTDPARATVVPGNHDRYTHLHRAEFERHFGDFLGAPAFPWLRPLGGGLVILGLDPCRPHLTGTGRLPHAQLDAARALLASHPAARPIVACHYPIDAPDEWRHDLWHKRLLNARAVADWLATVGPHVYACGHVHASWAFRPPSVPAQLCLNPGAPLLVDPTGRRRPGLLEITIEGGTVRAVHHAHNGQAWTTTTLVDEPAFWPA